MVHLALLSHNTGGERKNFTTKPIGIELLNNKEEITLAIKKTGNEHHITITIKRHASHIKTPKSLTQCLL